MLEIVFVHGTGVRRISYDGSLSLIRKQAAKYLKRADKQVHSCLWGEPYGAKLNLLGASIPTYDDQAPQEVPAGQAAAIDQVTWRMLREDPLFELRLLETIPSPKSELAPGEISPGETSLSLIRQLQPPEEFLEPLRYQGIESFWPTAWQNVVSRPDLERILIAANRDPREVSRSLARALVASVITEAAAGGHKEALTAELRDHLIQLLVPPLGGQPLGIFDWITRPLSGLAKRYGTFKVRRERRALSDASYPAAGDILLYQARGDKIRDFIREAIEDQKVTGDVIVFAHSLGGIAAVDLLVTHDFQGKVAGLVTVGSQAPLLYEIGALTSLSVGEPLPGHFPKKWLNFWDPNDFLSYSAERVFGPQLVKDVRVESKMPFPDSHGAYWNHKNTWTEIRAAFPWA